MTRHMVNQDAFKHMEHLPDHKKLCQELINFFRDQDGITGAFISGSGAAGGMDFYSDLDFGFICESEEAKREIWSKRYEWKLPAWFHRMDADHVKPHFIIYLFEPHIHVDLCFYTMNSLPPKAGAPYAIAFDKPNQLSGWAEEMNKPFSLPPDWANVIHEEERMWTWIHYAWGHAARGEYYDITTEFGFLRKIPHTWFARLCGTEQFDSRRLEQRGKTDFAEEMKLCYPMPNRASVKLALLNLIAVHNSQRAKIDKLLLPAWKTSQAARGKITRLVEEI